MSKILATITLVVLSYSSISAQTPLEAEQRRRTELMQVMDSAVSLMENEDYALAEPKLMFVLNNIRSIPSDLAFYFGKNSYHLGKFKQSSDWLNKYIQLRGTTGQHSSEAIDLIKKCETKLVSIRTTQTSDTKEVLSQEYEIDCGPSGKVTCPVCKGTTVLIKRGAFENEYKTCLYCDKHGILTCEEYNQLIRGELKPRPQ